MSTILVGTSGWAYPSWKPGFYPAGTDSSDYLRFYAERFRTVELNTTGYRLPAEEQFAKWAEQTPPGFVFAVKLAANRRGMLELLLGSLDPELRLAFDLQHPSWDGVEERLGAAGTVRVDDLETPAPFRYVRFRDPPYDDAELERWAERLRSLDVPVFAYFRHEDEPTAPQYAQRLAALVDR